METRDVELRDMLDARERRAARQREMLARRGETLICFTMNIAGPRKLTGSIRDAWQEGLRELLANLAMAGMTVGEVCREALFTGCEAYICVDADPLRVKELTAELEEQHPLGRLFDMDVLSRDGRKVERSEVGSGPRRCLICDAPASLCASRRLHTTQELQAATEEILRRFFEGRAADVVAACATRALLYEVAVTPKPGLVDRANNGAHRDMDFYTFLDSASALTPYFRDMALSGIRTAGEPGGETFTRLRFFGKSAETAMRRVTHGVNTHKGAVFSMGILCGAAGRLWGRRGELEAGGILREAREIAGGQLEAFTNCADSLPATAGTRLFRRYGITGVRGEAAAGFPSVADICLPALRAALEAGNTKDEAGWRALLALMANVTDTNIIARSDYDTSLRLRSELKRLTESRERLEADTVRELDREFILRNLSPGGCADLLAAGFMILFLEEEFSANPQ